MGRGNCTQRRTSCGLAVADRGRFLPQERGGQAWRGRQVLKKLRRMRRPQSLAPTRSCSTAGRASRSAWCLTRSPSLRAMTRKASPRRKAHLCHRASTSSGGSFVKDGHPRQKAFLPGSRSCGHAGLGQHGSDPFPLSRTEQLAALAIVGQNEEAFEIATLHVPVCRSGRKAWSAWYGKSRRR
jgi:hypothetical protein